MVISAGRGTATGRMIGSGIRMVSNMSPRQVRSRTRAVTGAIIGCPYPPMVGIMPGVMHGAACVACAGA
jgi:hypothetical protein